MNWQWNPYHPTTFHFRHSLHNWYWPNPYPYPPNPDYSGATFRNQPIPLNPPPHWGQANDPNALLRARPFGNYNFQQRPDDDRPYLTVNHPRHRGLPRWGQPIQPVHIPDGPRPVDMPQPDVGSPAWSQVIQGTRAPYLPGCPGGDNCNCGVGDDALSGAVPHNDDTWRWNIDNGQSVAPVVATRQFAMRRPAKSKLRRRQSVLSRISVLNEFTLAPRPTDWRLDYPSRPSGLLRRLSRIRGKRAKRIHISSLLIFCLLSQN
jgi:hypothetical protein